MSSPIAASGAAPTQRRSRRRGERQGRRPAPYRPGQLRPGARAASYAALLLFALIYIFPFLIELGSSFKTDADAANHPLNPIPQQWTLAAFRQLGQHDFPLW